MKLWSTALVLIAFIALGVFGALAMNHDGSHNHCIGQVGDLPPCPEENPSAYANLHLGALASFSSAVFSVFATILGLILGAVLVLSQDLTDRLRLAPVLSSGRSRYDSYNFKDQRKRHSWLALFEKRDPASY